VHCRSLGKVEPARRSLLRVGDAAYGGGRAMEHGWQCRCPLEEEEGTTVGWMRGSIPSH